MSDTQNPTPTSSTGTSSVLNTVETTAANVVNTVETTAENAYTAVKTEAATLVTEYEAQPLWLKLVIGVGVFVAVLLLGFGVVHL